jgi:hypothetical protein
VVITKFYCINRLRDDVIDSIADILYSTIPWKLRSALGNDIDDFVECLIFHHREIYPSPIKYKRHFKWMQKKCHGNNKSDDQCVPTFQ